MLFDIIQAGISTIVKAIAKAIFCIALIIFVIVPGFVQMVSRFAESHGMTFSQINTIGTPVLIMIIIMAVILFAISIIKDVLVDIFTQDI